MHARLDCAGPGRAPRHRLQVLCSSAAAVALRCCSPLRCHDTPRRYPRCTRPTGPAPRRPMLFVFRNPFTTARAGLRRVVRLTSELVGPNLDRLSILQPGNLLSWCSWFITFASHFTWVRERSPVRTWMRAVLPVNAPRQARPPRLLSAIVVLPYGGGGALHGTLTRREHRPARRSEQRRGRSRTAAPAAGQRSGQTLGAAAPEALGRRNKSRSALRWWWCPPRHPHTPRAPARTPQRAAQGAIADSGAGSGPTQRPNTGRGSAGSARTPQ